MGDHGAWLQVKYIGASQVWLHEWAVKTFSRERQPVHVCRGGTLRCKVREERGHHVWEFLILAPGLEPPSYVGRPKVREWRKLYADVMKAGGRPAQEGPGQDGDVQDRIARLKERLKSRKEGAERAPEERKEDAILQKRREEMIPPREEENDLKAINDRPQPDRRQRSPSMRRKDPENRRAPGLRDALVSAAAQIARDRKDSGGHRRRRRRSRSRKRRRRSKSGRRRSGSSHSRSSSTSSSSLVPPLQKKAARNPGSVLKLLMTNVADALAQAAVTDSGLPTALGPTANQISSYFQIVARPQLGSKVRDCRELETLARCLDLLRGGRLPELGDALAGRFLAVESAGLTNNWADAQHLEVIPVRHTGLAPPSVMLQAQKHTRQIEKASGRKTWPRPGAPQPSWGSRGEAKGDTSGSRGDGKGKGKGGNRKGGGKANKGAWRDKDKAEAPPDGGTK